MKKSPKIIFYGNPGFAVPTLALLLQENYPIIAVVTSPDKPAGRGLKIQKTDVKILAEQHKLEVLQPENLDDKNFIDKLHELNPDLQVVIAFRKLPAEVWGTSQLGTINLHPSILPDYRGAAPLNWAIINGEKETGITTIFINDKIDSGDIILQEIVPLSDTDTSGTLHEKLSVMGANLVLKSVEQIITGQVKIRKQPYDNTCKKAPKISKEDCRINWNKSSTALYNFIRGMSPHPCARTLFGDKIFKIYFSQAESCFHQFSTGTIHTDNRSFLKVATVDGFIHLIEVQLEGKKAMNMVEFLKGHKINPDSKFT